jgi:hypothetical protein
MRKKIYFLCCFIALGFAVSAGFCGSKLDDSGFRRGWNAYYHVTRLGNLSSIQSEGLSVLKAGDIARRGMSVLYYNRHGDDRFIKGSLNHVYVGKSWSEAKRYAEHMQALLGDSYSFDDLPVILKCDAHKHSFSNDPDDQEALRSKESLQKSKIFVLVMPSNLDEKGYYRDDSSEDDDKKSFWIPLSDWNFKTYKPSYPEEDTKCLCVNRETVRDFLEERITRYSHGAFSKKRAATVLAVDYRTMDKFLERASSLTASSVRKIIENFCKNFLRITCYDFHLIF